MFQGWNLALGSPLGKEQSLMWLKGFIARSGKREVGAEATLHQKDSKTTESEGGEPAICAL